MTLRRAFSCGKYVLDVAVVDPTEVEIEIFLSLCIIRIGKQMAVLVSDRCTHKKNITASGMYFTVSFWRKDDGGVTKQIEQHFQCSQFHSSKVRKLLSFGLVFKDHVFIVLSLETGKILVC